jgi:hypothetical protein
MNVVNLEVGEKEDLSLFLFQHYHHEIKHQQISIFISSTWRQGSL